MNWNTESNNLVSRGTSNYWKPESGQHKVKFLDEGQEHIFEWEGEKIPKVLFKVRVNDKEIYWDVTKGKTPNSLYGQIVLIGSKLKTLQFQEIHLVVKGQGKDTDYTILEALPLIQEWNKEESVIDDL